MLTADRSVEGVRHLAGLAPLSLLHIGMARLIALLFMTAAIVATPAAARPGPFMIHFENGSSVLSPIGAAILDNFVSSFRHSPDGLLVVLEGRADRVGTQEANRRLSCERVRVVERYLVSRGIHPGRTILYGYGEKRPLVETADEVPEAQNRNVTILPSPGRQITMRPSGRDMILVPEPEAC
jgi:hypothetical protein